jgi:hypothetical protein
VWRALLAGVPALATDVAATWLLAHLEQDLWPAAVAAAAVGLLAWLTSCGAPVQLAWDGQQWQADGRPGRLDLMLDLGPWMLLRWRGDAPTLWLPVSARAAGAHWHGLRVAAYAAAPEHV